MRTKTTDRKRFTIGKFILLLMVELLMIILVPVVIFLCLTAGIRVSVTDTSNCFAHEKYLEKVENKTGLDLFPSAEFVNKSEIMDYTFVYDSKDWLEDPVFYIRITLGNMDDESAMTEIRRITGLGYYPYPLENGSVLYTDNDSIDAAIRKQDSTVWDGTEWFISYVIIDKTSNTFKYSIIHVCDADSNIDDDIKQDLALLSTVNMDSGT